MTKEEVLHKHLGYHWDNQIHTVYYNAMEEYAKEVALKFYEFEESVPPENMEKHFDYFFEKFKSDYGI